jgi:hypothetical protein
MRKLPRATQISFIEVVNLGTEALAMKNKVGPMNRSRRCAVGVRRRRQRQVLEVSGRVVAS